MLIFMFYLRVDANLFYHCCSNVLGLNNNSFFSFLMVINYTEGAQKKCLCSNIRLIIIIIMCKCINQGGIFLINCRIMTCISTNIVGQRITFRVTELINSAAV